MRPTGSPPSFDTAPPSAATIGELLATAAAEAPNKPLIEFVDENDVLTRGALERESRQFAAGLLSIGFVKGDRIGLLMPNVRDFPIALFAAARIGAVAVTINTRSTPTELDFIARDCELVGLVVDRDLLAGVLKADAVTSGLGRALMVTGQKDTAVGIRWRDVRGADSPLLPEVAPSDPVTIMYTSGSTGMPKGCVHTHEYWTRLAAASRVTSRGPYRGLADAPYFYMSGLSMTVTALELDGTVVLPRRPSLSKYLTRVRDHQVTSAWATVHDLQAPRRPEDRDHELRYAFTDDIPGHLVDAYEERFGTKVRNCYASTEVGFGTFVPLDSDDMARSGSIGVPAPFRQLKLVDEDLVDIDQPGVEGEICVRGPGMFSGYHNRPEANANSFLDGGWFRTGDLGSVDEAGCWYFVGRIKDVVRRSGENISCFEVESALAAIPGIAEAAVVPTPDVLRGEEVKAFIAVAEGYDHLCRNPMLIRDALADTLAVFKQPRFIHVVDELPRLASDKVDKALLKQRYGGDRLGAFDAVAGAWESEEDTCAGEEGRTA
ncbi:class I adenylate-forming enzyme family protein [Kribbella speibonae]|uniref:Long-chain fatty acid--CoA ligase n=1 Tax=Kribbella speibonae TaxID=1572660 RepID=A0A4R0J566_9ACTN|nr:class I adenylate-forming enzyme family protein [Kribbella speibonae]TCC36455.1 long-chain fatty acid--CoA ligase [Kribbella speibonae]